MVWDDMRIPRRMVKKVVQCGRSQRRGEAYAVRYGEPLSDARTKLADFFNILLVSEWLLTKHAITSRTARASG